MSCLNCVATLPCKVRASAVLQKFALFHLVHYHTAFHLIDTVLTVKFSSYSTHILSLSLSHSKQAVWEALQYAHPCMPHAAAQAPAHTRLTPAAPSAPCAMNIHDRQAAARSGRWRRNWCCPYKLCSDLSSELKRTGDLDL